MEKTIRVEQVSPIFQGRVEVSQRPQIGLLAKQDGQGRQWRKLHRTRRPRSSKEGERYRRDRRWPRRRLCSVVKWPIPKYPVPLRFESPWLATTAQGKTGAAATSSTEGRVPWPEQSFDQSPEDHPADPVTPERELTTVDHGADPFRSPVAAQAFIPIGHPLLRIICHRALAPLGWSAC